MVDGVEARGFGVLTCLNGRSEFPHYHHAGSIAESIRTNLPANLAFTDGYREELDGYHIRLRQQPARRSPNIHNDFQLTCWTCNRDVDVVAMHSMRQMRLDVFVDFSSIQAPTPGGSAGSEASANEGSLCQEWCRWRDLIVQTLTERMEAPANRGMSSTVLHVDNLGIKPASRRGPVVRLEGFASPHTVLHSIAQAIELMGATLAVFRQLLSIHKAARRGNSVENFDTPFVQGSPSYNQQSGRGNPIVSIILEAGIMCGMFGGGSIERQQTPRRKTGYSALLFNTAIAFIYAIVRKPDTSKVHADFQKVFLSELSANEEEEVLPITEIFEDSSGQMATRLMPHNAANLIRIASVVSASRFKNAKRQDSFDPSTPLPLPTDGSLHVGAILQHDAAFAELNSRLIKWRNRFFEASKMYPNAHFDEGRMTPHGPPDPRIFMGMFKAWYESLGTYLADDAVWASFRTSVVKPPVEPLSVDCTIPGLDWDGGGDDEHDGVGGAVGHGSSVGG
eukprot:scaffold64591_cov37-Prasinocladus_malaysianus.AAC.1